MEMAQEREYRERLRKLQGRVEQIRDFVTFVRTPRLPQQMFGLWCSLMPAESHAKVLEHELDEIWDLLKRAM
jgi:hypothetical protein